MTGAGSTSPRTAINFDSQIFAMQEYGGVSRYFVRLAEQLTTHDDLDVRVVAPLHVNSYLGQAVGVHVYGRRLDVRRGVRRLIGPFNRAMVPALHRLTKPDVVHETYYASNGQAPPKIRTVLTVYDMIHEKFAGSFPAGDPTIHRKRAAIARADHICCISARTRADMIAVYPDTAARSSVTLLGFDSEPAGPEHGVPPSSRPYLLFVGQRRGYKNFDGLLAAYAASPPLTTDFDVVAVGGGGFSAAEVDAIGRAGVAGRVRQVDADDRALRIWYRQAAVFVYPSLYEGFGIPPLEAMAAGTPVVAIDESSVPEVCGDAAAYAQPSDLDSLRAAIEGVALSVTTADQLRAAGSRRLSEFSWQKCAAQTAAVYRAVR